MLPNQRVGEAQQMSSSASTNAIPLQWVPVVSVNASADGPESPIPNRRAAVWTTAVNTDPTSTTLTLVAALFPLQGAQPDEEETTVVEATIRATDADTLSKALRRLEPTDPNRTRVWLRIVLPAPAPAESTTVTATAPTNATVELRASAFPPPRDGSSTRVMSFAAHVVPDSRRRNARVQQALTSALDLAETLQDSNARIQRSLLRAESMQADVAQLLAEKATSRQSIITEMVGKFAAVFAAKNEELEKVRSGASTGTEPAKQSKRGRGRAPKDVTEAPPKRVVVAAQPPAAPPPRVTRPPPLPPGWEAVPSRRDPSVIVYRNTVTKRRQMSMPTESAFDEAVSSLPVPTPVPASTLPIPVPMPTPTASGVSPVRSVSNVSVSSTEPPPPPPPQPKPKPNTTSTTAATTATTTTTTTTTIPLSVLASQMDPDWLEGSSFD